MGFTLVELLVVIAIIVLLSVLAMPAISSLVASGNMTRNVSELSDTLELARQYATANNTYVWVAFYSSTGTNGLNSLSVAVLASNDGTDPASASSSWATYNYGAVPNPQISLVSKIVTLQQISVLGAGRLSVGSLPATPAVSDPANSLATLQTGNFFTMTLPGTTTSIAFTQAIEFQPSGQVRNGSSPINVIDLDIQPQKGTVNDTKNLAVLRINGLTGQTVVYRQ